MKHVVMFSGGVGSFCAAERAIEAHGEEHVQLLFTDTLIEDQSLYEFLEAAERHLAVPLIKIADGRNPWQVFRDRRFIGNTRVDPCSDELKRKLARSWMEERYGPEEACVHLGISWDEEHRLRAAAERWKPYECFAPMCDDPRLTRQQMLDRLRAAGIEPPALYALGFPHNNCGGFCVKAGC